MAEILSNDLTRTLGLNLPLQNFSSNKSSGRFFISNPARRNRCQNLLPAGSPEGGSLLAVAYLKKSAELCFERGTHGLSSPAASEQTRHRAAREFPFRWPDGNFLSQTQAGVNRTVMMLLGGFRMKPVAAGLRVCASRRFTSHCATCR